MPPVFSKRIANEVHPNWLSLIENKASGLIGLVDTIKAHSQKRAIFGIFKPQIKNNFPFQHYKHSWKFARTLKSCGNTWLHLVFPHYFSFSQTSTCVCVPRALNELLWCCHSYHVLVKDFCIFVATFSLFLSSENEHDHS